MKEMVYQNIGHDQAELLGRGKYKGYDYYILSLVTNPCAYVRLTADDSCYGLDFDDARIDCHGGITYCYKGLRFVEDVGWFIGWDYAHLGDRYGEAVHGKSWTTAEIEAECKRVIDQLISIKEDCGKEVVTNA